MVIQDSKDQFYAELSRRIEDKQLTSQELKDYVSNMKDHNASGIYELCSKFTDIGLNAPKKADSKSCDVQACFQFSDISAAKSAFGAFVGENDISDIEGFLEVVHLMHPLSVAWDDPRNKGGIVKPGNYDGKSGFTGKYHNFCELPNDIWNQIKDEILKEMMQ